ncbi:MAG: hypothetical protein NTV30_08910 [Chloroflexi bacterium]|nr:hypothetical protein [Chloroflexota bacterium]
MRKIIISLVVLASLTIGVSVYADITNNLWKFGSNTISPVVSTWTLGNTTNRISQGWFDVLNANTATIATATISGVMAGNLDMNNNLILNIGNAATDFVSGGGLNLAGNLGVTGTSSFTGTSTFAGNVGIGSTAMPGTRLEVNGAGVGEASTSYATTLSKSMVSFGASPTSGTKLLMGVGTSALYTWLQAQHTASASRIISLNPAGGNVGVGTTVPLAKFNVLDTISTSPRGILSTQISTDSNGARVGFAKARGTEASPLTVATNDMLGRFY